MRFYVFNILRTIFARVITFVLPELRRIHVRNLCIFPPVSLTICTFFFSRNIELLKNLLLTKKMQISMYRKKYANLWFSPPVFTSFPTKDKETSAVGGRFLFVTFFSKKSCGMAVPEISFSGQTSYRPKKLAT